MTNWTEQTEVLCDVRIEKTVKKIPLFYLSYSINPVDIYCRDRKLLHYFKQFLNFLKNKC